MKKKQPKARALDAAAAEKRTEERIGKIADQLTAKLRSIEEVFRKQYAPFMAASDVCGVELDQDDDAQELLLGFGRVNEKWQLYVTGKDMKAPSIELLTASLEIRRKAATEIAQLGTLLRDSRAKYELDLEAASEGLDLYLAELSFVA